MDQGKAKAQRARIAYHGLETGACRQQRPPLLSWPDHSRPGNRKKNLLSNRTTCELLFIPMGDDGGDRRLLL